MKREDLKAEMDYLQLQIEEQENFFDIALLDLRQRDYAKQIYKDIKVLEARLSELRNLTDQDTDPGNL